MSCHTYGWLSRPWRIFIPLWSTCESWHQRTGDGLAQHWSPIYLMPICDVYAREYICNALKNVAIANVSTWCHSKTITIHNKCISLRATAAAPPQRIQDINLFQSQIELYNLAFVRAIPLLSTHWLTLTECHCMLHWKRSTYDIHTHIMCEGYIKVRRQRMGIYCLASHPNEMPSIESEIMGQEQIY